MTADHSRGEARSTLGQSDKSNVVAAMDEFVHWLEGRMGRKLEVWERRTLTEWLQRIWLELQT
jgi:hypothetical protein